MSDKWNTPKWIADMLGPFTTDPCSNPTSHVVAEHRYSLENDQDGLTLPWFGSVFLNWPYSKPLPWAERVRDHLGPWCVLAKLDPSCRWYARLMEVSPTVAPFRKRIKFEGDKAMTANFPSALIYSAWRPSAELATHLWLPTYAQQGRAA